MQVKWQTAYLIMTLSATVISRAQEPELVLRNGNIYTANENMSQAQAVAIAKGKIIAVGSDAELAPLIASATQVIDLQGKAVVPGFIDSHYHFMLVGEREYYLNLDGTKSLAEFLQRVREEVARKTPGEWIIGRGWIEEDWPSKRFPTCQDLDEVAPDNPVILTRADGHAVVVNAKAMQISGVNAATPDPPGGAILKDEQGNCNGILLDQAILFVREHVPLDKGENLQRNLALQAQNTAFAYGITQIHDMAAKWEDVDLWKKMYKEQQLKIRIQAYMQGPGEDANWLLQSGPVTGLFDDRFSLRGIKIWQDGALGSRGAALLQPYRDADSKGLIQHADEDIYPIIKEALASGIQMAIHAIGDGANRNVLHLYEKALAEVSPSERPIAEPRFRIEHAQIVALSDIPRFKALGVLPSMQPSHAIGDLHFAVRRLGLERMPEAYAWRKFIDQGSIVPGGSDAPVEEGNPMIEFYAAVVRKDTTGFSAEGWHREYKMTREEALKSLTIWGATAAFMEDKTGSIEVGKYADLVVLDEDLMSVPESRLFCIKVRQTFVAGELVFDRSVQISSKE